MLPTPTLPSLDIRLFALDRPGRTRFMNAGEGDNLMQLLCAENLDVEAVCGGNLSCGTCHIYVDEVWFTQLPPPCETESALLESLVHAREDSRLACRLSLVASLSGLSIRVAPPEV